MPDLESLIRKLEAATEPSRELDGTIALAIGLYVVKRDDHAMSLRVMHKDGISFAADRNKPWWESTSELPLYTTSLDSALNLVPEGWRVAWLAEDWGPQLEGKQEHGPGGNWICYLVPRKGRWNNERARVTSPWCNNAPLALVIAALKARAAR